MSTPRNDVRKLPCKFSEDHPKLGSSLGWLGSFRLSLALMMHRLLLYLSNETFICQPCGRLLVSKADLYLKSIPDSFSKWKFTICKSFSGEHKLFPALSTRVSTPTFCPKLTCLDSWLHLTFGLAVSCRWPRESWKRHFKVDRDCRLNVPRACQTR